MALEDTVGEDVGEDCASLVAELLLLEQAAATSPKTKINIVVATSRN
jgi:hypothetical protein